MFREAPAVSILNVEYTKILEAGCFSDTLINVYQTTRFHIPKDCYIIIYRRESLKSQTGSRNRKHARYFLFVSSVIDM